MARTCVVTGKRVRHGCSVSHAHNVTNRLFKVNLRYQRFWVASQNRWVRLRISSAGVRLVNRIGIEAVLERMAQNQKKAAALAH